MSFYRSLVAAITVYLKAALRVKSEDMMLCWMNFELAALSATFYRTLPQQMSGTPVGSGS